jgi:DNA primase
MDLTFPKAIKYIHEILGLEYKSVCKNKVKKQNVSHPLDIFNKIKRKIFIINKDDIDLQSDISLNDYIPYPYIDWVRNDGIMPWTYEKFKIGFSPSKKRVIIPHRYWNGDDNEYIGIIGRTIIENYSLLDIPKYFPIKPYSKSINLYGLQENYDSIQIAGYVTVHEAERSVLKRHSRCDETGVAVCSHTLSEEQVRILISLDVEIIISYDKDVDINHIRSECENFYGIRNIYYVYDKYGLLKNKESPADKENKIYNFLFKHRVKYDKNEHDLYLKEKYSEKNKGTTRKN